MILSQFNNWNKKICTLNKCQDNSNSKIVNSKDITHCFIDKIKKYNFIMGGRVIQIDGYKYNLFIPMTVQVKRNKIE